MLEVASPPVAGAPPLTRSAQCWSGPEVFAVAREVSRRAESCSWMRLVTSEDAFAGEPDDLLSLVTYCYLSGVFHSADVARQLQLDPVLSNLRRQLCVSAAEVRRFRRQQRRALNDSLTRALLQLARPVESGGSDAANGLVHNRLNFHRLEPYYREAQDRIDRAILLDSRALDD